MTFICKVCFKEVLQDEEYYSPFVSDQYERFHIECKNRIIGYRISAEELIKASKEEKPDISKE